MFLLFIFDKWSFEVVNSKLAQSNKF